MIRVYDKGCLKLADDFCMLSYVECSRELHTLKHWVKDLMQDHVKNIPDYMPKNDNVNDHLKYIFIEDNKNLD